MSFKNDLFKIPWERKGCLKTTLFTFGIKKAKGTLRLYGSKELLRFVNMF